MIGQHDAARTDPDRLRAAGNMSNDHRGGRARDAGHVVMLGQPVAVIAPALGVLRQIEAIPERIRGGAAFDNRRQIENRERDHQRQLYGPGSLDDRVRVAGPMIGRIGY